ncbi:hypothetical protein ACFQ1M_15105 [Sungkyunkwania multivorans]|uniref:SnoaL-like domain-containing protein n=1 Tax=Sungkyunkwania multivorans TaxID=1173618 RepID=A0ABW3D0R5_9FLAO
MKTIKNLAVVLTVTLFGFSNSYAEDQPVKDLLVEYINAINNVGNGTSKEDVLALFNDRYVSNIATVRLSGTVRRTTAGKNEIATLIDEILADEKYTFRMTLDQVLHVAQKDRAGTVSALVNFESRIDDKLAEKGTIMMNLVATLVNGQWKIIHNNTVRVSEASDVGNCVTYIYGKGTTKFVTETYFPAGVEYGQNFEAFRVTVRDGRRVIKSDSNEFSWDGDGNLSYNGEVVGAAEEGREAVEMAVRHLYKESCVKIVFN